MSDVTRILSAIEQDDQKANFPCTFLDVNGYSRHLQDRQLGLSNSLRSEMPNDPKI
jgi:hypothetical protein